MAMGTGQLPHFVIAGTQKAGTTWLEHHLNRHPQVYTPRRQLHFFDKHFDWGAEWYAAQFSGAADGQMAGEKTTEYFDSLGTEIVAGRIAETCPDAKVIVILRDPAKRALSAVQHMVNSGLEPLPSDPDAVLFADRNRSEADSYRYIERGFYARQLAAYRSVIPAENILVLILEDDIFADPASGMARVCGFLGLDPPPTETLERSINTLRLSPLSIRLSRALYNVPYARGAIRRVDRMLGLKPWNPEFSDQTRARLRALYADDIAELEQMLGRDIPSWKQT